MATFETKYSVGDVVYHVGITPTRKQHQCPDCMGKRKWKAISPAGAEYEFSCPRCSANFQSNSDLSLTYTSFAPHIAKLTIGSIRVDTSSGGCNEYMCVETGVGSGSIYREENLFPTEAEALEVAKLKASEADKNTEWVAKLYDKTLSLSDYELTNAEREANKAQQSAFMSKIWSFFEGLEWSDDVDDMRRRVEEFRNAA